MKTAKEWKLIKAHRCLKCGGKCKEDKTKRMVIGRFWYCPKCDGKPVALMKRRLNEKDPDIQRLLKTVNDRIQRTCK